MKTILLTIIGYLLLNTVTVFAQNNPNEKNKVKQMNERQQPTSVPQGKPETKAGMESQPRIQTNTIEGKSGTQGQSSSQDTAFNASHGQTGNKAQTESGTHTSTGMIQGKSGTQGQTSQGETNSELKSTPQGEATTAPSAAQTQYRSTERLTIELDEVPPIMRETLNKDLYKGWDKSTIYYDKGLQEYSIDIISGKNTTTYRFDKEGKPLKHSPQ